MLLIADNSLVLSFRNPLFSPHFIGRLAARKVRQLRRPGASQTFRAEVFFPALRNSALDLVTQPHVLLGGGYLLLELAIIQSPVQATVVMQRSRAVRLPLGETDLKIRDFLARGSLHHKNSRIDETTAEIMGGAKALGSIAHNTVDPMP